jgi:hypothetical protein
MGNETPQEVQKPKAPLSGRQYEKFADWSERAALVALGSLVTQQIGEDESLAQPSVLIGAVVTALLYYAAYRLIRQS